MARKPTFSEKESANLAKDYAGGKPINKIVDELKKKGTDTNYPTVRNAIRRHDSTLFEKSRKSSKRGKSKPVSTAIKVSNTDKPLRDMRSWAGRKSKKIRTKIAVIDAMDILTEAGQTFYNVIVKHAPTLGTNPEDLACEVFRRATKK